MRKKLPKLVNICSSIGYATKEETEDVVDAYLNLTCNDIQLTRWEGYKADCGIPSIQGRRSYYDFNTTTESMKRVFNELSELFPKVPLGNYLKYSITQAASTVIVAPRYSVFYFPKTWLAYSENVMKQWLTHMFHMGCPVEYLGASKMPKRINRLVGGGHSIKNISFKNYDDTLGWRSTGKWASGVLSYKFRFDASKYLNPKHHLLGLTLLRYLFWSEYRKILQHYFNIYYKIEARSHDDRRWWQGLGKICIVEHYPSRRSSSPISSAKLLYKILMYAHAGAIGYEQHRGLVKRAATLKPFLDNMSFLYTPGAFLLTKGINRVFDVQFPSKDKCTAVNQAEFVRLIQEEHDLWEAIKFVNSLLSE